MFSSVTLCDSDSESEFSDFCKKPLYVPVRRRQSKYKNKIQDTHRRRRCIYLGALMLAAVIVVILLVTICNNNNAAESEYAVNAPRGKQKSILVLNWLGDEVPQMAKSSCTVDVVNITQPAITMEEYNNYDAVIMNTTAANVILGIDRIDLYRNSQLLIFATQKPLQFPTMTSLERSYFRVYDKSLSYSLTSDFLWNSYKVVRRSDSMIVAPSLRPEWNPPQAKFHKESTKELFFGEMKESSPLALTVLDGPCQEARTELVQRIMQNMDVDTYGECGEFKCSGNDQCLTRSNTQRNKAYKYYLAFEEELCVDYVGERFYKALNAHLVPVVFGGANYERFAPPLSYINARDYASVRELTEYLLYLDLNPEELIKYFTWHDTYQIQRSQFNFEGVCEYLQSEDIQKTNHSTLGKPGPIVNWLEENKCNRYELPAAWPS